MKAEDPIQDSLLELQRELVGALVERADQLTQGWRRLNDSGWDAGLAADLGRQVHNLRGEAALFGLERLLPLTVELEALFKRSVGRGGIDPEGRRTIDARLAELLRACEHYSADPMPDLPAELCGGPEGRPSGRRPLIYVVEDDEKAASLLDQQLRQFDFEVECLGDLIELEVALLRRRPSVLVMDIVLREGALAGVQYISKLRRREKDRLPVVFISSRDDMEARLHACRVGGNGYFTKPLNFHLLAERLDQLAGRQPVRPFEVLIVDDNLGQAKYYARALEKAGMTVSILTSAMDVLDHLAHRRPDLILLDLYMPDCSGPELAAVLQQHESYLSIPMVFLSAEDDHEQQFKALGLGGEDFLTKPIDPKHLIATVRPRAERGRALGSQIHRDGLTGLMTHSGQKAQLELELTRAEREGNEVSFAMVDLDELKSINDTYGHSAGDRVLCSLANLFKKRLRRTDLIARYGGDEFAIVMPNTGAEAAKAVLDEVSESFSRLVHTAGDRRFRCSLSCGIASFPRWPDAQHLTSAADRALYRAKSEGRNRVVS